MTITPSANHSRYHIPISSVPSPLSYRAIHSTHRFAIQEAFAAKKREELILQCRDIPRIHPEFLCL